MDNINEIIFRIYQINKEIHHNKDIGIQIGADNSITYWCSSEAETAKLEKLLLAWNYRQAIRRKKILNTERIELLNKLKNMEI